MKPSLRHLTAALIAGGPVGTWLRGRARSALAIVCYHRILDDDRRAAYHRPDLAVTPRAWQSHIAYFAKYFDCQTLTAAVDALKTGAPRKKPLLVITFDDGYEECFDIARPGLNEHGIPATFFVIAAPVRTREAPWYDRLWRAWSYLRAHGGEGHLGGNGKPDPASTWIAARIDQCIREGNDRTIAEAKKLDPDLRDQMIARLEASARNAGWSEGRLDRLMSADQVRRLADDGHEIGSHTRTHPILTSLPPESVEKELGESRRELEAMTGKSVRSLAYPNGDHDDHVRAIAGQAGYRIAVTTRSGLNRPDADPLRLHRFFISQDRLSTPSGRCSEPLMHLELSGLADAVFFRRRRSRMT